LLFLKGGLDTTSLHDDLGLGTIGVFDKSVEPLPEDLSVRI
jgi:hypothetical protein